MSVEKTVNLEKFLSRMTIVLSEEHKEYFNEFRKDFEKNLKENTDEHSIGKISLDIFLNNLDRAIIQYFLMTMRFFPAGSPSVKQLFDSFCLASPENMLEIEKLGKKIAKKLDSEEI